MEQASAFSVPWAPSGRCCLLGAQDTTQSTGVAVTAPVLMGLTSGVGKAMRRRRKIKAEKCCYKKDQTLKCCGGHSKMNSDDCTTPSYLEITDLYSGWILWLVMYVFENCF